MGRPVTKNELISASETGYKTMNEIIEGLSEKEMSEPFDFSETKKRRKPTGKETKTRGIY